VDQNVGQCTIKQNADSQCIKENAKACVCVCVCVRLCGMTSVYIIRNQLIWEFDKSCRQIEGE